MIRKHDELFCHQAVSTFDTPGTSAREWTERAWAQVHDTKGYGTPGGGLRILPEPQHHGRLRLLHHPRPEAIHRAGLTGAPARHRRDEGRTVRLRVRRAAQEGPVHPGRERVRPELRHRGRRGQPALRGGRPAPDQPGPVERGHQAHGAGRTAQRLDQSRRRKPSSSTRSPGWPSAIAPGVSASPGRTSSSPASKCLRSTTDSCSTSCSCSSRIGAYASTSARSGTTRRGWHGDGISAAGCSTRTAARRSRSNSQTSSTSMSSTTAGRNNSGGSRAAA